MTAGCAASRRVLARTPVAPLPASSPKRPTGINERTSAQPEMYLPEVCSFRLPLTTGRVRNLGRGSCRDADHTASDLSRSATGGDTSGRRVTGAQSYDLGAVSQLGGAFGSARSITTPAPRRFQLSHRRERFWVYPGFPIRLGAFPGFVVGDLMWKALWKLVENAQRFPRRGGRVLCVHGAVSFHRARPCVRPVCRPGRHEGSLEPYRQNCDESGLPDGATWTTSPSSST